MKAAGIHARCTVRRASFQSEMIVRSDLIVYDMRLWCDVCSRNPRSLQGHACILYFLLAPCYVSSKIGDGSAREAQLSGVHLFAFGTQRIVSCNIYQVGEGYTRKLDQAIKNGLTPYFYYEGRTGRHPIDGNICNEWQVVSEVSFHSVQTCICNDKLQ